LVELLHVLQLDGQIEQFPLFNKYPLLQVVQNCLPLTNAHAEQEETVQTKQAELFR
jgi:hypothetical protein